MASYDVFYQNDVKPFEDMLLEHDFASLFTGELYFEDDRPFENLYLPRFGENDLNLSPVDVARMFMAADESTIEISNLQEQQDGTPAGFNVSSENAFMKRDEKLSVIAYQTLNGAGVRLDNLHISRVMLDRAKRSRFCTIAFGLMATTAYRYQFKEITLFAAGRGPVDTDDPDAMVGYFVWPKFGFDASLQAVDVQGNPRLAACRTVQQVINTDPTWWEKAGSEREMTFDLKLNSNSWRILINYVWAYLNGGN
jgi:hypothetical protein